MNIMMYYCFVIMSYTKRNKGSEFCTLENQRFIKLHLKLVSSTGMSCILYVWEFCTNDNDVARDICLTSSPLQQFINLHHMMSDDFIVNKRG